MPNADPLFSEQWYLLNTGQTGGTPGVDLNVTSIWADYTGVGVTVSILDDGVAYLHPDLINNYDSTLDYDASEQDDNAVPSYPEDTHGTSVAGIVAASADNQQGGVGVAPGATLVGLRINFLSDLFEEELASAFSKMAQFDVTNQSWGYSTPFLDNFSTPALVPFQAAFETAVEVGRNRLGTVMVFAGGNSRETGDNGNYHNLQNSRFAIAVVALNHNGLCASYSTPGANLLVSAFGGESLEDGIVSTAVPADYIPDFNGTSAAAPMVSGIVALMLEANPDLGYRDVQEILAYSARQTDLSHDDWTLNGAKNWNGGGLHVSHDYGFGMVDAHAAVRLAETWTAQSTNRNEQVLTATHAPNQIIPDGAGELTDALSFSSGLEIDHVEVEVDITHPWIGDLEVVLTAPSGVQSLLVNRPGRSGLNPYGSGDRDLKFTFSSTHHWGETGVGTWTLTVRDPETGDAGQLNQWSLKLYGDSPSEDNTYIYTDEFAKFAGDPTRKTLNDTAGTDTLNAAAITTAIALNLAAGSINTLAGALLTLGSTTLIENAVGGDSNDAIAGNAVANALQGGRGSDSLSGRQGADQIQGGQGDDWLNGDAQQDVLIGGAGDDVLSGGTGNDILTGGGGGDRFRYATGEAFVASASGTDRLTDFATQTDKIVLSKTSFTALISNVGNGFSLTSEFASVATDANAAQNQAFIIYSRASGSLFYNPNGNLPGFGSGAKFAILENTPRLAAQHFILQA